MSRGLMKAALTSCQVALWRAAGANAGCGLRILYWHRVSEARDELAVHPARFRRQLDLVEAAGIPVVDLRELHGAYAHDGSNALALTFDDGYRELLDVALPELERRGWPATVFVVPGVVDGGTRFSWYETQPHPPVIGWDEMRAVEASTAVRFEPHTLTHPVLPSLPADEAWAEISRSKEIVEQRLGRAARVFAYPAGYYGAREVELARRAGFDVAVGCEYGANNRPWDAFNLRRMGVDRYDSDAVFAARLVGGTDRAPLLRRRRAASHLQELRDAAQPGRRAPAS
jgi:peptidoglycan/xylan/chitin deacetylase (PgdA/CDA1 family)